MPVFTEFGAFPPDELKWQMGKTAASIAFVKDVEEYLKTPRKALEVVILAEAIAKIKSGRLTLNVFTTPESFIALKSQNKP